MKRITVHTDELSKVCQFELEKSLEKIQEARRILQNQQIPNQFKYREELHMLAKKLESIDQECAEYKDLIKKSVLGFEQLSADIIRKANEIENVELKKYINR